jgi:3-phosphoshikimate 1-carboxyvinyltransferase
VRLPGSKSISNRVLLLGGTGRKADPIVRALLDSDDVAHAGRACKRSGCVGARWRRSDEYVVQGVGGAFPVKQAELFLGNAGTAFRPLTAALALSGGDYVLKGVPRMHERPIGDLVDGLRQLGADVDYLGNEGYPPLDEAGAIRAGGVVRVRGDVSSQFLTGLLMALAADRADHGRRGRAS